MGGLLIYYVRSLKDLFRYTDDCCIAQERPNGK